MIRCYWTCLDYSPGYNQHYTDFMLEIQRRKDETEDWATIHTEGFTQDWDDPTTPMPDGLLQNAAYKAVRRLGFDYADCVEYVERRVYDRGVYEPIPVELPEDRVSALPSGGRPF